MRGELLAHAAAEMPKMNDALVEELQGVGVEIATSPLLALRPGHHSWILATSCSVTNFMN